MTQHVLTMWRALRALDGRVTLFGAGLHTKWLMRKLAEQALPPPDLIVDEKPQETAIAGVPVKTPPEVDAMTLGLVVVSSDTYAAEMTARAKELWPGKTPIVNLYSDFERPHFQK